MSLLHPETRPSPTPGSKVAGPALLAGAALLLVGAGAVLGSSGSPAPATDPCGLPAGVKLGDLEARDASLVTRRLLACRDLQHGRIDLATYQARAAAIDASWTPEPVRAARPAIVWASTLRGFSTQYSPTSWSAHQVLGAPDVYPGSGDNVRAWASLSADDRDEWLEVGFDNAGTISAVEVYETFNPGATERIELVTASGKTIVVMPDVAPMAGEGAMRRTAKLACTAEPIVAARVHLASRQVAGWNEVDAIGVVPCARQ